MIFATGDNRRNIKRFVVNLFAALAKAKADVRRREANGVVDQSRQAKIVSGGGAQATHRLQRLMSLASPRRTARLRIQV
jgi:hypothetical protein